jgi:hypothetical protein
MEQTSTLHLRENTKWNTLHLRENTRWNQRARFTRKKTESSEKNENTATTTTEIKANQ